MHPSLFLAALCLGMASAASRLDQILDVHWSHWKAAHGKLYDKNKGQRRAVWEKNMKMIDQHNEEYSQGQHSFMLAMNAFGDLVPLKDRCSGKLADVVARSEQNLVDCCLSKGHEGRRGGLINYVFQCGKDSRSLDSEQSDPYHALVNGAPSLIKVEHFQGNDITYLLLTV